MQDYFEKENAPREGKSYPTNKKNSYSENRYQCQTGFEHYYYELVVEFGVLPSAKRVLEETINRINDLCGFFESYDPETDRFTTSQKYNWILISSKTVQNWCSSIKREINPK